MENKHARLIETVEQWNQIAADLKATGYTLFQMQYGTYSPEGFHVRFWLSGRPTLEFVTHSAVVQDAMVAYR